MSEEIYNQVFRSALVREKTKENKESPIVIEKYAMFCSRLISTHPNAGLDELYMAAHSAFVLIRRNPNNEIPDITIG